jgi:hypothetical protein
MVSNALIVSDQLREGGLAGSIPLTITLVNCASASRGYSEALFDSDHILFSGCEQSDGFTGCQDNGFHNHTPVLTTGTE